MEFELSPEASKQIVQDVAIQHENRQRRTPCATKRDEDFAALEEQPA